MSKTYYTTGHFKMQPQNIQLPTKLKPSKLPIKNSWQICQQGKLGWPRLVKL